MHDQITESQAPELSVVVLCFQAGEVARGFVRELHAVLEGLGISWELILVGNYFSGKNDPTPQVLRTIAAADPQRIRVVAEEKQGMMGWDVRSGLARARGRYIAFVDGDGQMPASDIVALYRTIADRQLDLVKTYRTKRSDGIARKIITLIYNWLFSILFPGLHARDINAKPKIFTREVYQRLQLNSDDWFIDAEIMIKARRYGLQIAEVPTVFYKNLQRKSYVRYGAIFEFLKNLTVARVKEFIWQYQQRGFSRSVLMPLAVAAAVRVAVFISWYLRLGPAQWLGSPSFTQPFFYTLGQHLARFGAFSLSEASPFVPNTFHVPLYPAFIALVMKVTDSVLALIFAHIVISLLVMYLLYRLVLLVWGERVAWWSIWLFALEPFSIYQSGVFYSEMLFLVFFFSALIFFFKYFSSPIWERSSRSALGGEGRVRLRVLDYQQSMLPHPASSAGQTPPTTGGLSYVAWCGLFLGLAILTRPVAQFSVVVFAAGLAAASVIKGFERRSILLAPLVLVLATLTTLAPWLARNYYHYKTPQLSFLSGYTFYLYNVGDFLSSKTTAFNSATGRDELRNRLREQFKQAITDPTILRIDEDVSPLIRYTNVFYKKGFELIDGNWPGYLKYQALFTASAMLNEGYRDILNALGIRNFETSHYLTRLFKPENLKPPGTPGTNRLANALLLSSEVIWVLVYLLIVAGCIRLLIRRDWQNLFIFGFFFLLALYFNTAAGSLSSGRYHFPSVPFILALAVYSGVILFSKKESGFSPPPGRTSPNPSS